MLSAQTSGLGSQHELIKCICNLCQCGEHNCSSYQLQDHRQSEPPLPDNRCLNSSSSGMSVAPEQATGSQCCCCLRQLAEERYLSTGSLEDSRAASRAKSVASQRNMAPSSQHETPLPDYLGDEELMHVLITKPQVASKPKDNIIFEGDMDLRTTFESTYEALAKMRLECWKKYQEGASSGKAHLPKSNNHLGSTPSPRDDAKQVSFMQQTLVPPEASINEQQASPLLHHQREQVGMHLASLDQKSASRVSETCFDQMQLPEQLKAGASTISAGAPSSPASGYVDPDLASIMVYNFNLDRLEKVSCRRRNKHRPLTSLRPGARGFFGDPEELESAGSRKCELQQQVTSSGDEREQPVADASSLILGPQQQPIVGTNAGADPSSQQQLPLTDEHSIKLNARNLTNSSQPQCSLLYSDENLPVDSKRKVRNNVNMIDHIRDQNIIESHYSAASASQPQSLAYHQPPGEKCQQHEEQLSGPQQHHTQSLSAADLLLAHQEEAQALEEIKKLTSPETQKTAPKPPEAAMELAQSATVPQENNSCRLRLQRTCQQQNFHISDNDYTSYLDQTSYTHSPASSQQQFYNNTNNHTPRTKTHSSTQYNNLFRESPDFILATSGLDGQHSNLTLLIEHELNELSPETALGLPVEPEVGLPSDIGQAIETDCYLDDNDGPPINNYCKVEALLDGYHYVGTKGDHKYFAQNNK